MNALTRFSMKNIGLIFLAMLLVLGGGLYAVSSMKMEQFPNVDIPYLSVNVVYPGATPSQVLTDVGKPLEQQLSTVKNLKNLYVTSSANFASVFIEFDMSTSMDKAETDVQSELAKVKLPDTAQKPELRRQGPSAQAVYLFALGGGGADQATVQQFAENKIVPQLSAVTGVSKVDIDGGSDKKIFVRLDPDKLKAHNLTLDKVKQTLIANNISAPTGDVTLGDKTMNVQVGKLLTSVDDVKNVNLILIEQNTSGMSDAFKSIGANMGQLGQAVGGLGQSVGGLAKGQALMEQQLQLMGALNQLSAQMMQDQAQLKMLQANPAAAKDPATAAQIKQLTAKIGGEQAKITALQGNLTQIQNALKATGAENQQHLQRLQGGSAPPSTPNSGSTTPSLSVTSLKLSEIADVTYGTTKEGNYTRLNGKPAVVIGIEPSIGANTVDVVKQVQVKLNAFKLPKGYTLTTLRDQSVEIEKSVYA
ncbi:MAG: efflux RND transporter permease subunit, partial [Tumebacillaceae bacterium]